MLVFTKTSTFKV